MITTCVIVVLVARMCVCVCVCVCVCTYCVIKVHVWGWGVLSSRNCCHGNKVVNVLIGLMNIIRKCRG